MADTKLFNQMLTRCNDLKARWQTRNNKIRDWYDILMLKDELAQDGMESVAGNDPRTGYNLGRHLVMTATRSHKIDQTGLTAQEAAATSYLEEYVAKRWIDHENRYRTIGRQGFLWQIVSWLLASGWYALFSIVENDRIWSECWSPTDAYPEFDDYGMCQVAHIYTVSEKVFARKARLLEWDIKPRKGQTTIYNHWGFDDDGSVANFTLCQYGFLKLPTIDPYLTAINRLPVFMSPVGGLPDMGSIYGLAQSNKWQEHFGEGIVATNEELGKNYNKMLTYNQQLVRDTAQTRWLELSSGDNGILTPENIFKRGAILRGAPGDTVTPLSANPIPVELRQAMMDYQNQLQRGMFPWSVFGNVQQQVSYLALASIASSSLSVLSPYVDALKGMMSDLNNYWFSMIKQNGFRPYRFTMPKGLPKEFVFESKLDVEIPGYLVQRATVARMLNPSFRLPESIIMNKLFPEVTNPLKAKAEIRKDDALSHPKAILADSILAYKEQARLMRDVEDDEGASLYEKLAQSIEAEIFQQPQQAQQPQQPQQQIRQIPREVLPQREMSPPEETGLEGIT